MYPKLSAMETNEKLAILPSTNFEGNSYLSIAQKLKQEEIEFDTRFITTHKEAIRTVRFSYDGSLCATGSDDASIKLIDVEKMKIYQTSSHSKNFSKESAKPVIR